MKTATDDLPGFQLQLDVKLGRTGFHIDFHYIPFGAGWLMQLHDFYWVSALEFGHDKFPSRRIRKITTQHASRISNLTRTSVGRSGLNSVTRAFSSRKGNQLVPDELVQRDIRRNLSIESTI